MLKLILLGIPFLTSAHQVVDNAELLVKKGSNCDCGDGGNGTDFIKNVASLNSVLEPYANGSQSAYDFMSNFNSDIPSGITMQLNCIGWNTASEMWNRFNTLLSNQCKVITRVYNETQNGNSLSDALYFYLYLDIDLVDDSIRDSIGTLNAMFDLHPCCVDKNRVNDATDGIEKINKAITQLQSLTGEDILPNIAWNFNITETCNAR